MDKTINISKLTKNRVLSNLICARKDIGENGLTESAVVSIVDAMTFLVAGKDIMLQEKKFPGCLGMITPIDENHECYDCGFLEGCLEKTGLSKEEAFSFGDERSQRNKVEDACIIVEMIGCEPYYQIRYRLVGDKDYYIGYGSYSLEQVNIWFKEEFEVVGNGPKNNSKK